MDHLTTFVGECDRKTEAAKKRLAETQEELSAEVAAKAQKVCLGFSSCKRKQKILLSPSWHLGTSPSGTNWTKTG